MSEVAMISLIATGIPDSGPGRRATSGGRYSNALSAGSAAFALARQAAAYLSAAALSWLNTRRSSRTLEPAVAKAVMRSVPDEERFRKSSHRTRPQARGPRAVAYFIA